MNRLDLILIALGKFALCGACFDWEWFMNHRKARFFTAIIGRVGTRIFYALLSVGLVFFGVLPAIGVIHDTRSWLSRGSAQGTSYLIRSRAIQLRLEATELPADVRVRCEPSLESASEVGHALLARYAQNRCQHRIGCDSPGSR
jgi:Immunity protein 17